MILPKITTAKGEIVLPDPPLAHMLFSTTRFAWLFTIIRVYLGWQWLQAGVHKVEDSGWVVTGEALKGFWERAVAVPAEGRAPISYSWYRAFLHFLVDTESHTWFAKLVAYGEVLIGVGLIVGAFVGIAAFFGGFLNWNFLMAGTASTNGMLFILAVILMLAWKVAGYYGFDYYLLPYMGTPWGLPPREPVAAGSAG